MDVGTRIREHREAAGMRQDQLAELCHVSRQTIRSWERNKTLPDIVSLKVIAHELGTTVDALIGDDAPEIKRRTDAEARRFLTLYLLNLAFMLASDVMNVGSNWGGHAFDAPSGATFAPPSPVPGWSFSSPTCGWSSTTDSSISERSAAISTRTSYSRSRAPRESPGRCSVISMSGTACSSRSPSSPGSRREACSPRAWRSASSS